MSRYIPYQSEICKGCDRHIDDEDYGRDPDCDVCFRDPTPLTQEQVTAPAAPAPDTRDKHDWSL